jgi:hypothetical protein
MSPARRLVLAWVVMSVLTLAAIFVGHAQTQRSIGAWLAGALMAMTFAKAAILLSEYLDLRHAPAWNRALRLSLFLLLAILFGLSAAAL